MPPEIWALAGVVLSILGGIVVAKLHARSQDRTNAANVAAANAAADVAREDNTVDQALAMAKEAKTDSAAAKVEAAEAHKQAGLAQRALHQTRIWYLNEHLPWDRALMAIAEKADPVGFAALPRPQDPPLWPTDLAI